VQLTDRRRPAAIAIQTTAAIETTLAHLITADERAGL